MSAPLRLMPVVQRRSGEAKRGNRHSGPNSGKPWQTATNVVGGDTHAAHPGARSPLHWPAKKGSAVLGRILDMLNFRSTRLSHCGWPVVFAAEHAFVRGTRRLLLVRTRKRRPI